MTYEQIKKKIRDDYNRVAGTKTTGRQTMKAFYVVFSKALEELNNSVGPFITDKDMFIEQIKYKKDIVDPDVYDAMIEYCNSTLKLNL